ncbi:MAG TPA: hypothetical protein VJI13_04405 [Candidatus Norongarragalinales archaeon]|nr:hypothetical protein [Candidatus Norongarragalinales archaeon]
MVQAIIDISDRANRVLNLVKAKYDLQDKSDAIEKLASEYERKEREGEETAVKMQLIQKYESKIPFTKSEEEWMEKFDWHPVDEKPVKHSYIKRLKRISKGRFVEARDLDDLIK